MKFATKYIDENTDDNGLTTIRLEAYVNHARQGIIIGFKNDQKTAQETKEKFSHWRVEGDPMPNNTYPTDDDAIIALCNKNGRKLKLDKDGKVKKRK